MNRHRSHPVLLEKLKTNGVEPGFIYRNDWSPDDTRNFMADIWSPANQASLDEFVDQTPSLRAKRDGNPPATRRELAMAAGLAHPCGMAAVAERILERELGEAVPPAGRTDPRGLRAPARRLRRARVQPAPGRPHAAPDRRHRDD